MTSPNPYFHQGLRSWAVCPICLCPYDGAMCPCQSTGQETAAPGLEPLPAPADLEREVRPGPSASLPRRKVFSTLGVLSIALPFLLIGLIFWVR